jgi:hypothetical protein
MADYKSDKITGKQRAKIVTIENQLGSNPKCIFDEEIVVDIDGSIIQRDVGILIVNFAADKPFDLISPSDGSVIGSMTHGELYAVLYSLYINAAAERDAALAVPIGA